MTVEQLVPLAEHTACLSDESWRCASLVNDSRHSDLPGLIVVRKTLPGEVDASIYSPVFGLILRGATDILVGAQAVSMTAGQMMLVSHELPVTTRINDASVSEPYLAVFMSIDLDIIRSLVEHVDGAGIEDRRARALETAMPGQTLIEALGRYLSLSGRPLETEVMLPLIRREIHFRLLTAPIGGMLRNLLSPSGHANKISRAIRTIRAGFREPLALPALASAVGMSQSSFHSHFKSVTGTTPLQYQKDLRLIEARRLLSEGAEMVTSAAFAVGYESASQFSREYLRKFGMPPSRTFAAAYVADKLSAQKQY